MPYISHQYSESVCQGSTTVNMAYSLDRFVSIKKEFDVEKFLFRF